MFKKALISTVISVFIGVFVFGVSTVFGAPPEGDPPGGLVTPTFSGVVIDPAGSLKTARIESDTEVVVDDDLKVTGSVTLESGAFPAGYLYTDWVVGKDDLFVVGPSKLYLQAGVGPQVGAVIMDEAHPTGYGVVLESESGIYINPDAADVNVAGHLKAESIGSYSDKSASWVACPSPRSCSSSVSCGVDVAVSCGVRFSDNDTVAVKDVYRSGNTCYVNLYNSSASTVTFRSTATCFDPEG